ncbi:MAG: integrase core domain-containing protein [Thermomicrobiales bacterium]
MAKSTRSSRATLKTVGSGSSVNLFSALPVGAGQLPHAHRLSKRAKQRLKWLDYHKTHSVAQTCRHFDIPRSTLHRWEKRCDPRDLSTLEDRSSRPHTVRQRTWGTREVEAVLAVRTQYPRWGKAKLAGCPLGCMLARQGILLARSMIDRILRYLRQRRLLVEPRPARVTARTRHARPHAQRKAKGVTIPKDKPGDLVEIDTMRLYPVPGVIRYHFSAIDVVSRFGVIGVRGVATAGTAKEFLAEVRARSPFAIKAIQIDGGSEFMAAFEQECADQGIPLWVLPPHSPKLNGQVERMNRTCREEWWEGYAGETDLPSMQEAGRAGEAVYNAIRPHQALGMRTPVEFLADEFGIHA